MDSSKYSSSYKAADLLKKEETVVRCLKETTSSPISNQVSDPQLFFRFLCKMINTLINNENTYKMYGIFENFSNIIYTHLEAFFIKDYEVLFSPAYTEA